MKTLEENHDRQNRCQPSGWKSQPTILLVLNHTYGKLGRKTGRKTAFLGPTGFDLKIKIMQACRELTWTTVINPCQTINAKTNSLRNFQLAA